LYCWNITSFSKKYNTRKHIAGVQKSFCWRTEPSPEKIVLADRHIATGGQTRTPEALDYIAGGHRFRTPAVTEAIAGVQTVRQRYLLPLAGQRWRTPARQ